MTTTIFKLSLRHILLIFLVCASFLPLVVSADSVSDSQLVQKTLYTFGYGGPYKALGNPNITVTYGANILNADKDFLEVSNGDGVTVGTNLILRFKPHEYTDIYWFGTGYFADSPYGDWFADEEKVPKSCDQKDFVAERDGVAVYIPLAVKLPDKSITNLDGLECGSLQKIIDVFEMRCKVIKEGNLNPTFRFAHTEGRFYYRLERVYTSYCRIPDPDTPLSEKKSGGEYILQVPTMQIPYHLTAITDNKPPAPPTITVKATACTQYEIALRSTDPDGDKIRFGFDWTDNGKDKVNEWFPLDHVPGGSWVKKTRTFATPGMISIKVLTEDEHGRTSDWKIQTFDVTDKDFCTFAINLTATPSSIWEQGSTLLEWGLQPKSREADNCSLYKGSDKIIDSQSGSSGSIEQAPPIGSYIYKAICKSIYYGEAEDIADVAVQCRTKPLVCIDDDTYTDQCTPHDCPFDSKCKTGEDPICVPNIRTITVNPTRVRAGQTTQVHWETEGSAGCRITGTNGDTWTVGVGGVLPNDTRTSKKITAQTTYTLECGPLPWKTATVNVVPSYQEI